ncbi:hypothetical protein LTR85_003786 [Meristemomyces frigidus]|nr:hypothetical protein LTR85_003786 [Meristemomyces frigidus]
MDGIEPMEAPPEPLNVDRFWNTDRVRRAVQSEWVSRFGVRMTINRWRQCYPAKQRKFTRNKEVADMLDVLYDDSNGRVKQAAVSRMIGDAVEKQSGGLAASLVAVIRPVHSTTALGITVLAQWLVAAHQITKLYSKSSKRHGRGRSARKRNENTKRSCANRRKNNSDKLKNNSDKLKNNSDRLKRNENMKRSCANRRKSVPGKRPLTNT